jgi:NADPH:quinone reductase-like Zn-dependent oxidoreductase
MSDTATMRAISQDILGGPEVLREVVVRRPVPGIGEILVAVRAAGVNPTDWKNRAQALTVNRLPLILGWDVSGVVAAVGIGVTLFKPGDEVFGMLPYPNGVGAYAEYVTGPTRAFTRKPAAVDHVQAGALPLAALTAYQALVDTADVQRGQRVLIHAAAGGVGHLAVQIAKSRGAYVIGTASAAKHDFLRSLGADELIDYRTVDFTDAVSDIDVVVDPIAGDTSRRSLDVPRPRRGPGGRGRPRRHERDRRPRRLWSAKRPHRGHLPAGRGGQGPRPRRNQPHYRQNCVDRGAPRCRVLKGKWHGRIFGRQKRAVPKPNAQLAR